MPTSHARLALLVTACAAAAHASPSFPPAVPPRRPAASANMAARAAPPSVDTFVFLDNGVVRLGIDASRGGTLGFLGPSR